MDSPAANPLPPGEGERVRAAPQTPFVLSLSKDSLPRQSRRKTRHRKRRPAQNSDTQPLPPPDANPVSCIQSGNPESETSARLALLDSTSQIGHLVSGLTANSVGSATLSRVRRRLFTGPVREAQRVSPPPHAAQSLRDPVRRPVARDMEASDIICIPWPYRRPRPETPRPHSQNLNNRKV